MIGKSKNLLGSILIQILIWIVLGNVLLFYQPFLRDIEVPYQFWLKQTFVFSLLIGAYYLNAYVLVPTFLLKKRNGIYFLLLTAIIIAIVFLTGFADRFFNIRELLEEAFHKRGPIKRGFGKRGYFDTFTIILASLVLGISTSVAAIQTWQNNNELQKQLQKFYKEKANEIKNELIRTMKKVNDINFICYLIQFDNAEQIKNILFELKNEIPNLFCFLAAEVKGKGSISVIISEDLQKAKQINAGNIVKELAKEIGGGGGGQAFYAQAGGNDLSGLMRAMLKAETIVAGL